MKHFAIILYPIYCVTHTAEPVVPTKGGDFR